MLINDSPSCQDAIVDCYIEISDHLWLFCYEIINLYIYVDDE